MHCWKSINVKKQYGFYRIFMLSTISVLTIFSFLHIFSRIFSGDPLQDHYFSFFIIGFFLIYPIHKAFHVLPLIYYMNKITIRTRFVFYFVPIMFLRVKKPIPKILFIIALIFPFVMVNGILLTGAVSFPNYAHYFTMLTAYHSGICLVDFLYAKYLFRSPKDALIEEFDEGYEILVPEKEINMKHA
ncbi:DUF3267 domain-containing protein [Jeotgalibacillus soli]|uniref:DUF3267 domain-containing protein n=1 Tax=Jeotgalibacillus soli TaxID=889306 RepID=A0A0C2R5S1_9BACL|nr:DUF3267 domain-containing protein [Jeotgalibacillus soli]KIL45600.1 hypothetical protein KP78_19490 [Jeotgalibacillus soli]